MSRRSHEECVIDLKAKFWTWGFDNNDLSTIAKNKHNIGLAMEAILNYLENFKNAP